MVFLIGRNELQSMNIENCLFTNPYLTMHHSYIGVNLGQVTILGMAALISTKPMGQIIYQV
jgi:hypothetical protein